MESTNRLLRELNAAQRAAVSCTEGPLLVLAGAGTGKTRVITYRIVHLLGCGAKPGSILAVTFTNKAAREMRERVRGLAGGEARGVTLSTFHSLGARILRENAARIGLRPGFSIADDSDQVSMSRTVVREVRGAVAVDPKAVLAAISRAKNGYRLPEQLLEESSDDWEHLVAECYLRYQDGLRERNCVDFDDLILLPGLLLEKEADLRHAYQARFRYLLVDEYQDTNGAQYRFLRSLVGPERNLCVVGDDDQSIYGFRGAEMDKILGFERDFPGSRVVKLEENYRSTSSILDLANAVIASNRNRHPKVLRSTLGSGSRVRWVSVPDEAAEVDFVLREIVRLIEEERERPESIAILLRAAIQARPFEEKLRLRKIRYRLVGGPSYFDRKEVRDLLAYWKAASNPHDDLSLLRILNVPRRGFGASAIEKVDALARQHKCSFLESLGKVAVGGGDAGPGLRKAAEHVSALFARARERLLARDYEGMARSLVDDASYKEVVDLLYPDPLTRQARWSAVEQLLQSVAAWQSSQPGAEFSEFLGSLALEEDARKDDAGENRGITLMTLHSAKGLEFPHVFLVGVEENLLPHRRSAAEGDLAIEEERRLFYVGITRAQRTLTLTQADLRVVHGEPRPREPSRFLTEVSELGLLERGRSDPREAATPQDVRQFVDLYRRIREK